MYREMQSNQADGRHLCGVGGKAKSRIVMYDVTEENLNLGEQPVVSI